MRTMNSMRWLAASLALGAAACSDTSVPPGPGTRLFDLATRGVSRDEPAPDLQRNDPTRRWQLTLTTHDGMGILELPPDARGQPGVLTSGTLSEEIDYGPQIFDTNGDGKGSLEVFSAADGTDFWVGAEAPGGTLSISSLRQSQSFIKRSADARLQFSISQVRLAALDFDGAVSPSECPWGFDSRGQPLLSAVLAGTCDALISTAISLSASATDEAGKPLLRSDGEPALQISNEQFSIVGIAGRWQAGTFGSLFADQLEISDSVSVVVAQLRSPIPIDVDLSQLELCPAPTSPDDCSEITVNMDLMATAYNARGGIESGVGAFIRDPVQPSGVTFNAVGLEPTNRPVPELAVVAEPIPCGGEPDPAAGVLQFSAPEYALVELPIAGQGVAVTRSGGSRGAVSATLSLGGGSAIPGEDYTPVTRQVRFGDGEATTQLVPMQIPLDEVFGGNTFVNLTLSDPGGCAQLGPQSTATLHLLDDDAPPPVIPDYGLGGTVSGLEGSGLTLTFNDQLVTDNGAFSFAQRLPDGFQYSVRVREHPSRPNQICGVSGGEGRIDGADVTNLIVTCNTLPVNPALDSSFGSSGLAFRAPSGTDLAMLMQPDGKLLVAERSASDFHLTRLNADGSLDAGFGAEGSVGTDVAAGLDDEVFGLALQADGKIIAVGRAVVGRTPRGQSDYDFAVARYLADGSLDVSFGTAGTVSTDFNDAPDLAHAVVVQPDGKLVVVGVVGFDPPSGIGAGSDFGLARYDAAGQLDPSFGTGGKLTTHIAGRVNLAQHVALLEDGSLLVAGPVTVRDGFSLEHAGLARYGATGALDPSFGASGILTLEDLDVGRGLALQPDGKILLVGNASVGAFPNDSNELALVRRNADGSPDLGFGNAGRVITAFDASDESARTVAIQPDGKILVGGLSVLGSNSDFALARFDSTGALDASFASGGLLRLDFFGGADTVAAVVVQADGKLLLAGTAQNGLLRGVGIARVLP